MTPSEDSAKLQILVMRNFSPIHIFSNLLLLYVYHPYLVSTNVVLKTIPANLFKGTEVQAPVYCILKLLQGASTATRGKAGWGVVR